MTEHYDVIIIGTGAGGGTLAHTLAGTGKRILLLERGDYLPREKDNWDAAAVFIDSRYISKDTWYDADGKPFQPQVHYLVGGAWRPIDEGLAVYLTEKLHGPAGGISLDIRARVYVDLSLENGLDRDRMRLRRGRRADEIVPDQKSVDDEKKRPKANKPDDVKRPIGSPAASFRGHGALALLNARALTRSGRKRCWLRFKLFVFRPKFVLRGRTLELCRRAGTPF